MNEFIKGRQGNLSKADEVFVNELKETLNITRGLSFTQWSMQSCKNPLGERPNILSLKVRETRDLVISPLELFKNSNNIPADIFLARGNYWSHNFFCSYHIAIHYSKSLLLMCLHNIDKQLCLN